jgi:PII-like signaling protein
MKTHPKKQMTVICEAPVMRRITRILDKLPVTGYTVFPALSGRGSEGEWNRDNWIGDSNRMVMIVSVMSDDQADTAIDRIYEAIEPQMGIVTVADVAVLRPERF